MARIFSVPVLILIGLVAIAGLPVMILILNGVGSTATEAVTQVAPPTASTVAIHLAPTVSAAPTAAPVEVTAAPPAAVTDTSRYQVNASQAEFSVTSGPTGVPSGSVQVNVTNHGAVAHEFVIMQTDNPPNALLFDDTTQKAVEDAPGQQDVGEVGGEDPFILPGQTLSGTFDLAPGRYVFLCNIPGHYKAGMYTSFTVGSVSPATNVPTAH